MIGVNHLGKRHERLANQMFQYAAIKGIAKNRGFEYCIPPSGYKSQQDEWTEHQLFNTFELKSLNPVQIQFMDSNLHPYKAEAHFHFDEELFNNCPDWMSLVGFFQSEKYFLNVRDELLEDFTFKNNLKETAIEFLQDYDSLIALHIRRTDYVNYNHHPIQPLSYYEKALKYFDDDRTVIIFSDDPQWCYEQSLFKGDRFLVSENDHLLDLCMMTLCSDFIIANSSFSWWGAWLSENPDKKVIAPKKWFGPPLDKQNDTKDLYCEGWETI
tara:strand:- start:185 stop:994 length:810 start_codon:yes stop_codon:yes gene_type:complete